MNLQAVSASVKTDKRKIALIPILAGMLIWNLTGTSNDRGSVSGDVTVSAEQKLTEAESLIRQLERNRQHVSQKNWPALELGDIVDFDPFSLVGTLAERSGVIPDADVLAAQATTADGDVSDTPRARRARCESSSCGGNWQKRGGSISRLTHCASR